MRAADHRAVRAQVRRSTGVADLGVSNHGNIFLLHAITPLASDWLVGNLPSNTARFGEAYVVEHRYVGEIVNGAQRDGLVVA